MGSWRNGRDYRLWRVGVIRRDKVCKICGSNKRRHAHHLNHATFFILLRFKLDNGICLCGKCHSIFHNKFIGSTRKKCTNKDFIRFNRLVKYIKGLSCTNSVKEV